MSLLRRIVRGGGEFRSSGLANPAGWLLDSLVSSRTDSGERVTPATALGMIPVYGAVSMISSTVGKIPCKVYRNLDGDKEEQRDHRAWRMLHDAPNPLMPAGRFWRLVVAHKLLYGNAMAEMRRSDPTLGLVDELWPLDPRQVTIAYDGRETKTFILREGQKDERRIAGEDVLHWMDFSLDGIVGLSRLTQCRMGIGAIQARAVFESSFYLQGAKFQGIVEHPGRPNSKDATKNLRESIAGIYGGGRKAHQVGVLWEGANFKPVTMAMRDLEFVASKQLSATEVAVLFNLPPNKLGGLTGDSMTYANVEQNQIQYVQEAVEPQTVELQQTMSTNVSLFPQVSYFAEFELEALMRGDHPGRAAYYEKMFALKDDEGKRAIAVDEIRARENLPPAKAEKPAEPPPIVEPPVDPLANANGNGNGPIPPELARRVADTSRG